MGLFLKYHYQFYKKRDFLFKYILFFILTLTFSNAKTIDKSNLITLGYLYNHIFTTKKESIIAERLWKEEMKSRGFNIELLRIEDEEKAIKLYEDKKISALVSDGTLYYKYKDKIDKLSALKWIVSKNDRKFNQYYLIKNKNLDFNFKNMNNMKIYYKDHMAKLWFEYLLHKNNINSKNIIDDIEKIKKEKNLIFNTFFNKNSIAIIAKDLYDDMLELNPQIKEKIVILEKSKTIFFRALGFTRNGLNKEKQDILLEMTDILNGDDTNFNVLNFIQIQKIFHLKNEELNQTDEFFDEYFKLKKSKDL